ncbi:MAG: branched-chain amino acid ABC transporter permease [Candidatus Dormibacteria bacterium]
MNLGGGVMAAVHVPLLTIALLGLAKGAIFAVMALGITLVYKASRVINFAQGEIGTVAAFVAWWFIRQHDQPWLVGAIAAVAVACGIGYLMHRLIALPMRDAPRTSVMIATLGVSFLLFGAELKFFGPSPETLPPPFRIIQGDFPLFGNVTFIGLRFGFFTLTPIYILSLAVAVVVALGLAVLLTRTRFGLGVLATAQDAVSARLLGIPSNRVSAFTWMAAAALGAVAGLLIAPTQGIFYAFQMSGFLFFRGLVASLLGGMDSLVGAVIGGIVVGEIDSFTGFTFIKSPGLPEIVLLAAVLLVMLLRPRGLLGSPVTA